MQVQLHVHSCVYGGRGKLAAIPQVLSTSIFEAGLSLAWGLPSRLGWIACQPQGFVCHSSQNGDGSHMPPYSGPHPGLFYNMNSGGLNSGPHACKVS